MCRKFTFALCLALLPAFTVLAEETAPAPTEPSSVEPKALSGMSIIGNDDAPKSLYIVPWKSAEIGKETSLTRMLDERAVPVDREVFQRELDFYQVSTGGDPAAPAAVSGLFKPR